MSPFFSLPRLRVITKLCISFSITVLCMIIVLMFSVGSLREVREMEREIARYDIQTTTAITSLSELMKSQQQLAMRIQFQRQAATSVKDLFNQVEISEKLDQKNAEFRNAMNSLKEIYLDSDSMISEKKSEADTYRKREETIKLLEKQCNEYLTQSKFFAEGSVEEYKWERARRDVDNIINDIRTDLGNVLSIKRENVKESSDRTILRAQQLAVGTTSLSLLVATLLIRSFIVSIGKLKVATSRIANGEFDYDPQIPRGDEFGELSYQFKEMANRLKELDEQHIDASPLTLLPGNIAIERSINKRLSDGLPFSMCYLDLDNFKSYNDRYGYIKGSELIKAVGESVSYAVKSLDSGAFVGHIGGDDFVAIVDGKMTELICQAIIRDIDALIPSYYSAEDREVGFLAGVDRYGVQRNFPLVSISIVALGCHKGRYANAEEISGVAAEIKDRVKKMSGSNYFIVRGVGIGEA